MESWNKFRLTVFKSGSQTQSKVISNRPLDLAKACVLDLTKICCTLDKQHANYFSQNNKQNTDNLKLVQSATSVCRMFAQDIALYMVCQKGTKNLAATPENNEHGLQPLFTKPRIT